jgi:hypothetical protein
MFLPILVLLYKLNTLVLKQKKLPVLDVVNLYGVISCNVRDHVRVTTTLESSRLPIFL